MAMSDETNRIDFDNRLYVISGGASLANAIGVELFVRGQTTSPSSAVLVIGSMGTGNTHQDDVFAQDLAHLAECTGMFDRICVIETRTLHRGIRFSRKVKLVRDSLAEYQPHSIYVCRNWQWINECVLAAFPKANTICIGDGYGTVDLNSTRWQAFPFNPEGFRNIDRGILFFPQADPASPDALTMLQEVQIPPVGYLYSAWTALAQCAGLDAMDSVIHGESVVLVATGRLAATSAINADTRRTRNTFKSSLRRMRSLLGLYVTTDQRVERAAQLESQLYAEQLLRWVTNDDRLIIKPHPRDATLSSLHLQRTLVDKGIETIVVNGVASVVPTEAWVHHCSLTRVVSFFSSSAQAIIELLPNTVMSIQEQVDSDLIAKYAVVACPRGGLPSQKRSAPIRRTTARILHRVYVAVNREI